MPNASREQHERRNAIRELLSLGPADNQQALVDALIERGFDATQSSVSRDLRSIGAIKTADGYNLPPDDRLLADQIHETAEFIRDVLPAGPNLLVIKTAIGAAQRVALALDRAGWPEMVGNIGGDDTVFVATEGAGPQKTLIHRIARARNRA